MDGIFDLQKRCLPAGDFSLTGVERTFAADEIIVSKTDPSGRIIYANEVFMRVSGFGEQDIIGKPHSLIRHPAMPRCVFKLLWTTIQRGDECFAYVINRAANGDHYWVLAHITATFDETGAIASFHSSRRVPQRTAVAKIQGLYQDLLSVENRHDDREAGMEAAYQLLQAMLTERGVPYDEFVFAL